MIITLTGENTFGRQQALAQLVDAFVRDHGDLSLERIDGETAEPAQMREALTSLPFLAARKMVVLRAPSASKPFVENIEQLSGEVPETTDVIIVEPKLDKRLSYYKFLQKQTDFREFPELDANGLMRWLSAEAKARGGSLAAGDARYLVERIGVNQQLLAGELEKLLLYKPEITRQSIELLTEAAPQSTIFQLLEAAFDANGKRALKLYAEQRAQNVEPPQIIAMLAWQLHVLALIKTAGDRSAADIAREARLSPFVVQKSQRIARSLTLSRLKKLVSDLLKIDTGIKRTGIDADEALQHYLLTLAA